jgi:hypothetical protein
MSAGCPHFSSVRFPDEQPATFLPEKSLVAALSRFGRKHVAKNCQFIDRRWELDPRHDIALELSVVVLSVEVHFAPSFQRLR